MYNTQNMSMLYIYTYIIICICGNLARLAHMPISDTLCNFYNYLKSMSYKTKSSISISLSCHWWFSGKIEHFVKSSLLYSLCLRWTVLTGLCYVAAVCKHHFCESSIVILCSHLLCVNLWFFSCIIHKYVLPLHRIWKRQNRQLLSIKPKHHTTLWNLNSTQWNSKRRISSCVCSLGLLK